MKVGKHLSKEEILKENEWVEDAKSEARNFSKLYDRYFESIFGFIFRRTEDEQLTSDLTSQTFLKALQNIKKYEFRGLPFSAWLFRIATNEVNRYFRKKGKSNLFSIEEDRVRELVDPGADETNEHKIAEMLNILRESPTEVIEILELRFFENRSFKEISYILNITESGAKMRTYRAIEKLRKIITFKSDGDE